MSATLLVCLAFALVGMAVMVSAARAAHQHSPDIDPFLRPVTLDLADHLSAPFSVRVVGALVEGVARRIEGMLPRNYLDKLDRQLAQAGLTGRRRAGAQLAAQASLTVVGVAVAVVFLPHQHSAVMGLALILLPVIGWLVPNARLKRQIRERSNRIVRDIPDIIDMMAVAVEAGSGFEAAMSLVCSHFDSPLTDELSVALRQMELGMSRREAFHDLKQRSDLEVVRTFALSLLQADALGIPIGRVLRAQSNEVRNRQRAWAREKAAKLPVKILFPLVLFIFPPILAIVLGPAAIGFQQFGH